MADNDRRIRRTKRALHSALSQLLTEKDLRHITVRELAGRANIHRATFYLHYRDVYDLYEQSEKEIVTHLKELIAEDSTHSYELLFIRLIYYLYDNQELSRMLLARGGETSQLLLDLYEDLERKYIDIWRYEVPGIVITDRMRYIASYHVQGSFSLISAWVRQDFSAPRDAIVDVLRTLDASVDDVIYRLRA